MFDFSGRVALVTGASGALGSVVARRFLDAGGRVALVDRGSGRLAGQFPELASASDRAATFVCELSDAAAVSEMIDRVVERFGRLDHLFNVAGAYRGGESVEAISDESWSLLWRANFLSTLHVCRAAMSHLERSGGSIVNVGSKASLSGGAGAAAYSVSKTAVLRLTESLAEEGKERGVRANVVLPGTIDTLANRAAMPDADPSRWVEPDAVADVMLFLASSRARAVTGAALPVFGRG